VTSQNPGRGEKKQRKEERENKKRKNQREEGGQEGFTKKAFEGSKKRFGNDMERNLVSLWGFKNTSTKKKKAGGSHPTFWSKYFKRGTVSLRPQEWGKTIPSESGE